MQQQNQVTHSSTANMEEMVGNVKALFFRRCYKKCANYCVRLLSEHEDTLQPAYKIFLLYFAGISNDCYARGMYNRSPLIPSTLEEAEDFFTKAQALVSEARILTPHSFIVQDRSDYGDESDDGRSSRSLHRSRRSIDTNSRPSTAATSISTFSTDTDILFCEGFDYEDELDTIAAISPLNVRKYQPLPETPSKLPNLPSTSLFSQPSMSPEAMTSRPNPRLASFYLLRFPPSEPPPMPTPPLPHSYVVEDIPYPDDDDYFHEPDHVEIYNSQLSSFSDMIAGHLASIHRFRAHAHSLAASGFMPATKDDAGKRKMSPEEKTERIAKGRARKWARPRFDPTRFQELCELAIAEL